MPPFFVSLSLPPGLRVLSLDIELNKWDYTPGAIRQYAETIRRAPASLRKIVLRIVLVRFTSMAALLDDLDDALASRAASVTMHWKLYLPQQVWLADISKFEDSETAFWRLLPRSKERFFSGDGHSGRVEMLER